MGQTIKNHLHAAYLYDQWTPLVVIKPAVIPNVMFMQLIHYYHVTIPQLWQL